MTEGIDKQRLYGDYRDQRLAQDKLHLRAAHKALDIPEDPMSVNVTKSGIGALGAIGIAAAAGLPGLAAVGLALGVFDRLAPQPPAAVPAAVSPVDSDYVVRFYDKDGKLIDVPHVSEKPR